MAAGHFVHKTIILFTIRTLSDTRPLQRTPTPTHEAADRSGAHSGMWIVRPTYRRHSKQFTTPVAGVE